jgi:hypothetical protein
MDKLIEQLEKISFQLEDYGELQNNIQYMILAKKLKELIQEHKELSDDTVN